MCVCLHVCMCACMCLLVGMYACTGSWMCILSRMFMVYIHTHTNADMCKQIRLVRGVAEGEGLHVPLGARLLMLHRIQSITAALRSTRANADTLTRAVSLRKVCANYDALLVSHQRPSLGPPASPRLPGSDNVDAAAAAAAAAAVARGCGGEGGALGAGGGVGFGGVNAERMTGESLIEEMAADRQRRVANLNNALLQVTFPCLSVRMCTGDIHAS